MKYLVVLSKKIMLVTLLLLSSVFAFAQPDPICDPLDPYCPIDDYYGVFIFAILAIAVYKAHRRTKISAV